MPTASAAVHDHRETLEDVETATAPTNLLATYRDAAARLDYASAALGRARTALMTGDSVVARVMLDRMLRQLPDVLATFAQVPPPTRLTFEAKNARRNLNLMPGDDAKDCPDVPISTAGRPTASPPVVVESEDLVFLLRHRRRESRRPFEESELRLWAEVEAASPGIRQRLLDGSPQRQVLPGWNNSEVEQLRVNVADYTDQLRRAEDNPRGMAEAADKLADAIAELGPERARELLGRVANELQSSPQGA